MTRLVYMEFNNRRRVFWQPSKPCVKQTLRLLSFPIWNIIFHQLPWRLIVTFSRQFNTNIYNAPPPPPNCASGVFPLNKMIARAKWYTAWINCIKQITVTVSLEPSPSVKLGINIEKIQNMGNFLQNWPYTLL